MGGHSSSLSVKMTTNMVSDGLYSTTQNCLVYANSDQKIVVNGNGNIVQGNTQQTSVQVDQDCYQKSVTDVSLQQAVNSQIIQSLKDQQVAMTQWLDSGKDDVSTTVSTNVTSKISVTSTQNCIANLSSSQAIIVQGNENIVSGNVQKSARTAMLDCVQGTQQTSSVTQDTTNSVNQHGEYQSENPFAFITDAITACFKSALIFAAVAFIIIVALVFVFMIFHHKKPAAPEIIVVSRPLPTPAPVATKV